MNVAIYLFDLAEELDWGGPWEVLRSWARGSDGAVSVYTVADARPETGGDGNSGAAAGAASGAAAGAGPDGAPSRVITCAKGLRVLADHTWETAPDPDVILIPGGDVRAPQADEALLERLRK